MLKNNTEHTNRVKVKRAEAVTNITFGFYLKFYMKEIKFEKKSIFLCQF